MVRGGAGGEVGAGPTSGVERRFGEGGGGYLLFKRADLPLVNCKNTVKSMIVTLVNCKNTDRSMIGAASRSTTIVATRNVDFSLSGTESAI